MFSPICSPVCLLAAVQAISGTDMYPMRESLLLETSRLRQGDSQEPMQEHIPSQLLNNCSIPLQCVSVSSGDGTLSPDETESPTSPLLPLVESTVPGEDAGCYFGANGLENANLDRAVADGFGDKSDGEESHRREDKIGEVGSWPDNETESLGCVFVLPDIRVDSILRSREELSHPRLYQQPKTMTHSDAYGAYLEICSKILAIQSDGKDSFGILQLEIDSLSGEAAKAYRDAEKEKSSRSEYKKLQVLQDGITGLVEDYIKTVTNLVRSDQMMVKGKLSTESRTNTRSRANELLSIEHASVMDALRSARRELKATRASFTASFASYQDSFGNRVTKCTVGLGRFKRRQNLLSSSLLDEMNMSQCLAVASGPDYKMQLFRLLREPFCSSNHEILLDMDDRITALYDLHESHVALYGEYCSSISALITLCDNLERLMDFKTEQARNILERRKSDRTAHYGEKLLDWAVEFRCSIKEYKLGISEGLAVLSDRISRSFLLRQRLARELGCNN